MVGASPAPHSARCGLGDPPSETQTPGWWGQLTVGPVTVGPVTVGGSVQTPGDEREATT